MAEADAKVMSKRASFTERLKKNNPDKYPGNELDDDETLFGQVEDDYNRHEEELNGYKEREGKMVDLFNKDPRSAQFITDMARGEDPLVNVINRLGIDGVTDLLNDPEKKEAYAKANQDYIERLAKSKELDEENERNLTESLALIDKIQTERGLSDEEVDAAYELLSRIINNGIVGKIDEESFDLALKAVNHDRDVTEATDEGRVAGRNQKIEESFRKPKKGDGTPQLSGSNNAPSNQKEAHKNIFDLAREGASGR